MKKKKKKTPTKPPKHKIFLFLLLNYVILLFKDHAPQKESDQADSMNFRDTLIKRKELTILVFFQGCNPQCG